jgi:hypothetical protein
MRLARSGGTDPKEQEGNAMLTHTCIMTARCDFCEKLQPLCSIRIRSVFGSWITVIICRDSTACTLRVHLRVHARTQPNPDCVFCMAGANVVTHEFSDPMPDLETILFAQPA